MARIASQPKINDLIAAGQIAPIAPPTERPGLPAIPTQDPGHSVNFRGPIADDQWTSGDAQRQWYNKNIPQSRISPSQPAQSPQVNATIQSIAAPIIAAAVAAIPPSTGGGGVSSVDYVGNELVVTNPTSNVVISKTAQPSHDAWMGALPGLTGLEDNQSQANTTTGAGPSITATPATSTYFGLYASAISSSATSVATAGWASLDGASILWSKNFSVNTPSIVNENTVGANAAYCNMQLLIQGTTTLVQLQTNSVFPNPSPRNIAFPGAVTAGNYIVVVTRVSFPPGSSYTTGITDNVGNVYFPLVSQLEGSNSMLSYNGTELKVYVCTGAIGGATTVSFNAIGTVAGGTSGSFGIYEFTPFAGGTGLSGFRPITPSDIPNLDASKITTGKLALLVGGTGASLNTTGGTSQVLRQSSTGAAITVSQLDYPDLLGTSPATLYDGVTLAGKGLSSIVFQNSTMSLGNIASINVGTLNTGLYRVTATLIAIVGTTGIGDVIPECDFTFNDPTLAANTIIMTPVTAYIALTTTYTTQSVILNITSSSPAHFSTTGYAGTGTYRIVTQVEQI